MSKILRFFRDESGATAIEYGLIAAGISVAIITVVGSLGTQPEHDLHVGADRAQVRSIAARKLRHSRIVLEEQTSHSDTSSC